MTKMRKTDKLCDEDCNHCPLMTHPNARLLTVVFNQLLKYFGPEVYPIVQKLCPNLTVCYDCRIDDFCHVADCKLVPLCDDDHIVGEGWK